TFALDHGESITLASSPDPSHPTALDGATLRGGNDLAPFIVAHGDGYVAVSATQIDLARGVGIGLSGVHATLSDVEVSGNFDPATAIVVPSEIDPTLLATFAVAAIGGASVTSTNLTVRRVAVAALACTGASWAFHGATLLEENLGFGISAEDCDATLDDVE